MEVYRFKLYVAGDGDLSRRAIVNLTKTCETLLYDRHQIEIIDILENPRLARQERILATPMMVKFEPEPVVRMIGDLADAKDFAVTLGLTPQILTPQDEKDADG